METIKLATLLVVDGLGPLFATKEKKSVWRIMVPEKDNHGRRFSNRRHRDWEQTVINISHGWTIHKPARGAWQEEMNERVQFEEMRPVDIICSAKEIKDIVEMTAHHYMQIEVLAYKLSDHIIDNHREMYRNRALSRRG